MDPEPHCLAFFFTTYSSIFTIKVIVLLLLLAGSALISGAEVALFGLSQNDLEDLKENHSSRGKMVAQILERPRKLFATLLITNNIINIGIVLLFSSIGETIFSEIDGSFRFLLKAVVAIVLILMFGEILPKIYANRNRVRFSRFMAVPLKGLNFLFTPLSSPMRKVTLFLEDNLGEEKSSLSVDHLSQALELASEGDTTKEEQKILEGIVNFGNTDTRQVMQPRIDIFAINEKMKFPDVLQEIKKNGYSRIPVFSENMDNVLGVLYVKDLLPYIDRKTFNWMSLIREPYFVPENKKLDDLLLEFQDKKIHLAVVVDEYGGTSGIVTLEDIIEEIVGDISDEFDDEDLIFSKLDDHTYVFDGKTALKDFYKVAAIENEEEFESKKGESETIAGFVLEISGSFPKQGEKVVFKKYQFIVESMDKKRLKRIKVILPHEK